MREEPIRDIALLLGRGNPPVGEGGGAPVGEGNPPVGEGSRPVRENGAGWVENGMAGWRWAESLRVIALLLGGSRLTLHVLLLGGK